MYFVTKVVFKRVSIYVWDAYELFMIRTFLITFIFLMTKLYTTSLHLIFGLKKSYCTETSIIRLSCSTKLCTLYFALHSPHFQPQIECRAQVFTRSMLLYWELRSCKVWGVGFRVLCNSGWIKFCRLFRELARKFPYTTLNNTRITLLLHYCSFLLKIQLLYTYKCTSCVKINMQPHRLKTRVTDKRGFSVLQAY